MNTSDLLEQLLRGSQGAMPRQGGSAAGQGDLGDLGGLLGIKQLLLIFRHCFIDPLGE